MNRKVATVSCHRLAAWVLCVLSCTIPAGFAGATGGNSAPFRIGFSSAMFTDVNENDAKAAIKIWGEQVGRERNISIDPDPLILRDTNSALHALRENQVDAVGITTIEYHQLRRDIDFSPVFLTYHAGAWTEQYLVLTHREGPVKTLADLGGRRLVVHQNARASLAPLWLDTLLHRQGHPPAARFTARIEAASKLSGTVLPVFFRQMDACLATRSGFETMDELNPQLARQLIILGESPAVVPALFAFRTNYHSPYKADIIAGVNALRNTPAGRQVLIIFQSDDIAEKPLSILESALELIEKHERIVKEAPSP